MWIVPARLWKARRLQHRPESVTTGVTTDPSAVVLVVVPLTTNWFTSTLLVHEEAPLPPASRMFT